MSFRNLYRWKELYEKIKMDICKMHVLNVAEDKAKDDKYKKIIRNLKDRVVFFFYK